MKSVLISINPKWCELIASGKKTVEVRKTRPKLETPFKCYIYMTSGDASIHDGKGMVHHHAGGRCVIGEFVCGCIDFWRFDIHDYDTTTLEELAQVSCVKEDDLLKYADLGSLYGWHISDLKIYDNPISIQTFRKWNECYRGIQKDDCEGCWDCEIKKPPQSWCYVEEG